jgi:hypothetical protein
MRAWIELETFTPIGNTGRQQIFAEHFARYGGHNSRIDDHIDLHRTAGVGVIGGPAGDAHVRDRVYTANQRHTRRDSI